MKRSCSALFLSLVLLGTPVAAAGFESHESIRDALDRMYNFDFPEAHRIIDAHIVQTPDDPVGLSIRAAAYLFYELDRLRLLEMEFLEDDEKISGKTKLKPDPAIAKQLYLTLNQVQEAADARLAKDPKDIAALFSLCIMEGVLTDYKAFVEKKQLGSLKNAKASNSHAVQLLEIRPDFYDAYLTTGINEYLMASLPFFVRWFVRMDKIKGSKKQGFKNLQLVAERGEYFGPFAKILLSIIWLREKKPERTLTLLTELNRDYPENHLLKKELARVTKKLESGKLVSSGAR